MDLLGSYETWKGIKEWNDWIWVYSSGMILIPSTIITLYKIYQFIKFGNDSEPNTLNKSLSTLFKVLNSYCFVYYFFDCACYIMLGKIMQVCYQGFFLHHITSLVALYNIFHYKKQIYWFEMLVGTGHAWNLTFPTVSTLQYVYIGYMFLSNFMVFMKPYSENKWIKRTKYCYPFAYLAFLILLKFDCLGMMDTSNTEL